MTSISKPCDLCITLTRDSWTWCKEMRTCSASIDWEKVYNGVPDPGQIDVILPRDE